MEASSSDDELNFCQACSVRNHAICADLDDDEIALLNKIGRRRELATGEPLLWEGEEAVLVANVVSGILKLATQTCDGREQILGLAYPSDFLGRPFGDITPYNAEALSDTVVCEFRRSDFERFALQHPKLEHKLLERTLGELDRTRRWMLLLGRMNAEEKLATLLLEISERSVTSTCSDFLDDPDQFELPMSRQQIADILGLTIETVSRQFSKLREGGVIAIRDRRNIIVQKRTALESLAS